MHVSTEVFLNDMQYTIDLFKFTLDNNNIVLICS